MKGLTPMSIRGLDFRERFLERLLIPLSVLALPVFFVWGAARSIWLDEANSIFIASQTFQTLVDRLRIENNLPAYYLMLRGWIAVLGDSEMAVRLLSSCFYVAAIGVVFLAGRSLSLSTRSGLYCAFFYLISSQAIHTAQTVRMYSAMGFLAALSIFCFLRLLQRGPSHTIDGATLAFVNAVGSFTHMWFFFLIGAEVAASALFAPRKRAMISLSWTLAAMVPFVLLWLPVLVDQLDNGASSWMPPFRWIFIVDIFLRYYGGGDTGLLGSVIFYAICVVLLNRAGRSTLVAWTSNPQVRILGACLGISLLLAMAVSVVKPIYFSDRYTIIALPALALLLGEAMARFAPRLPLVLFCYFLLGTQIAIGIQDRNEILAGPSDRRTAEFLNTHVPRGDILAFTSLSRMAIDHYLGRLGCGSCYRETSFPSEIDQHPSWRPMKMTREQRNVLELEARHLVEGWERSGADSVWLLYGGDPDIGSILKEEIEKHFPLEEEIPIEGPYHKSVLRYRMLEQ